MAGDGAGDVSVATDLPGPVEEWLDEQSRATGISRAEFLRRLLIAHRLAAADGQDDFSTLREDLDRVDEKIDEKVDDVRDRVIQVKREADGKAPADHDHEDLRESVAAVRDDLDGVQSDVASLETAVESVEERADDLSETVEEGFENYEEILEYLTDTVDELEMRTDTLARAALALREEVATVAADHADRTAAAELARAANQQGIATAECEACGSSVDIGLLHEPTCPHCRETFTDVEAKSGFFGSHTLRTGERPALEGGDAEFGDAFEELAEEDEDG